MGKLTELQQFTGTGELYQMLDLLRNKDLYDQRMKAMEDFRNKVNDSLKQLGLGKNIERLHAQAEGDRRVAGEVLEKAEARAQEVYGEISGRREELLQEMAALEAALVNKTKELATATRDADSVLGEAQAEADALIRKSKTDGQEAQRILTKANQILESYEKKKRKVEELIGKFGGV